MSDLRKLNAEMRFLSILKAKVGIDCTLGDTTHESRRKTARMALVGREGLPINPTQSYLEAFERVYGPDKKQETLL